MNSRSPNLRPRKKGSRRLQRSLQIRKHSPENLQEEPVTSSQEASEPEIPQEETETP